MDLSQVYGSSVGQASPLREYRGGRMLTVLREGREWPPQDPNVTVTCESAQSPLEPCYLAGLYDIWFRFYRKRSEQKMKQNATRMRRNDLTRWSTKCIWSTPLRSSHSRAGSWYLVLWQSITCTSGTYPAAFFQQLGWHLIINYIRKNSRFLENRPL